MTSPGATCSLRSSTEIVPVPLQMMNVSAGSWLCSIVRPPGCTTGMLDPNGVSSMASHGYRYWNTTPCGAASSSSRENLRSIMPVTIAKLVEPLPPITLPQHEILEGTPAPGGRFTASSADAQATAGFWSCDPGRYRFHFDYDEFV